MAAQLFDPYMRAVDANGNTLSGAKWYFTASGTTTSQPAYTTSALTTQHANPVVADSGGLFEEIYLDLSLTWRARLYTTGQTVNVDTPLVDVDPVALRATGISTQSGTTYTLLSSDDNSIIHFTSASAVTVTVPSGLGTAFICGMIQRGTGQVTVSAGGGVTMVHKDSLYATQARYVMLTLIAASADNYTLVGLTA